METYKRTRLWRSNKQDTPDCGQTLQSIIVRFNGHKNQSPPEHTFILKMERAGFSLNMVLPSYQITQHYNRRIMAVCVRTSAHQFCLFSPYKHCVKVPVTIRLTIKIYWLCKRTFSDIFFIAVPCSILILSKSFIYQLMQNRAALK